MKRLYFILATAAAFVFLIAATRSSKNPYGFSKGTPVIKSISALAFGPDGNQMAIGRVAGVDSYRAP